MTRQSPLLLVGILSLFSFSACGGSAAVVDPDTDEFDVSPADQALIEESAAEGSAAEGSYAHDPVAGNITFTITDSTFACGLEPGSFTAIITSLTATTMIWEFVDDGGEVTWTRVDSGSGGVVGVWHTDDPNLYLILSGDGTAQIFGDNEICDDNDQRERNDDNCVKLSLSGEDITVDGNFSDWSGVSQNASLEDVQGDYDGDDAGADLERISVEFSQDTIYVLSKFHQPLSTNPSIQYRITIRGDASLSLYEALYYDTETQTYRMANYADEISAAAGPNGIEWSIDVSAYAAGQNPFETIDMIMIDPMDCSGSNCEGVDYMDCGWFSIPQ